MAGDPRPNVDREFGVKAAREDLASREVGAIDRSSSANPEPSSPPAPANNPRPNGVMDIEDDQTLASANGSRPEGVAPRLTATLRRLHVLPKEGFEGARPVRVEIYAYKSHCQPYRAWLGFFATSAFIIFNGWWVFVARGGG